MTITTVNGSMYMIKIFEITSSEVKWYDFRTQKIMTSFIYEDEAHKLYTIIRGQDVPMCKLEGVIQNEKRKILCEV